MKRRSLWVVFPSGTLRSQLYLAKNCQFLKFKCKQMLNNTGGKLFVVSLIMHSKIICCWCNSHTGTRTIPDVIIHRKRHKLVMRQECIQEAPTVNNHHLTYMIRFWLLAQSLMPITFSYHLLFYLWKVCVLLIVCSLPMMNDDVHHGILMSSILP